MPRSITSILAVGSLLALLGAGCATATPPAPAPAPVTPTTTTATSTKTYTLDDVAPHSGANDCWMVIAGKVYDVTSFIPNHPGGQAILQGCGKNATAMFTKRPDDTAHSPRAEAKLDQFYIGEVKS